MLRAIADEHVVGPLIQALRRRGMDVITVEDIGRRGISDVEIMAAALAEQRLILTNDTDFLSLAAAAIKRGDVFAPIVYWPQQKRTIQKILNRIIPLAKKSNYQSLCSKVFYL